MFSRTKAATLALLAAATAAFQTTGKAIGAQVTKTQTRHSVRNAQGIDLFYLSKSYRSKSKYQPHEGKRQAERFQRNYASDAYGIIRPLSRAEKRQMSA